MDIRINYIRELVEQIKKINNTPLEEIVLYDNGKVIEFPPESIERWKMTGLNNMDYLKGEGWKYK